MQIWGRPGPYFLPLNLWGPVRMNSVNTSNSGPVFAFVPYRTLQVSEDSLKLIILALLC